MGSLLVKYLGLRLSMNRINDKDCTRLHHIIQRKLEGWSSKLLSLVGMLELTHNHHYYLYVLVIISQHSSKTNSQNWKMCANFIWRGKLHKVSWKTICKQKKAGGLRLRNTNDLSEKCNLKLFWKFLEDKSLWTKWMRGKKFERKFF